MKEETQKKSPFLEPHLMHCSLSLFAVENVKLRALAAILRPGGRKLKTKKANVTRRQIKRTENVQVLEDTVKPPNQTWSPFLQMAMVQ
jgi:hypothetical protein